MLSLAGLGHSEDRQGDATCSSPGIPSPWRSRMDKTASRGPAITGETELPRVTQGRLGRPVVTEAHEGDRTAQ